MKHAEKVPKYEKEKESAKELYRKNKDRRYFVFVIFWLLILIIDRMQYYMLRRARKPMEFKRGESRASEKQNPAASQRGEKGGKLSLPSRIRSQ